MYVISILTSDGSWAYLCPTGNGDSYILNATMLGAAIWPSYESALMMKENLFPNSSQTIRIRSYDKPANVLHVTGAQARAL